MRRRSLSAISAGRRRPPRRARSRGDGRSRSPGRCRPPRTGSSCADRDRRGGAARRGSSALPRPRPCAPGSTPTTYTSPSGSGTVSETACTFVKWKPSRSSVAVSQAEQHPVGVEPGLRLDRGDVVGRSSRSARGARRTRGCSPPPRRPRPARPAAGGSRRRRARPSAGSGGASCPGAGRRMRHSSRARRRPARSASARGARVVAVGPEPRRRATASSTASTSAAPIPRRRCAGCTDELGDRVVEVLAVEQRVPDELAAVAHEQVPRARAPAVDDRVEVAARGLGVGVHPVGRRDRGDQRVDLLAPPAASPSPPTGSPARR